MANIPTSLFITLGKQVVVSGVLYNYKDVIYNDNKNENENKNNEIRDIKYILTEGQACAKMDYCFRDGMHIFVRRRNKHFTYMGTANSVEVVREWSDTRPTLYHIELKPSELLDPECVPTPQMVLYKTSYKIAAFVHVGLPIPVKCGFDSGVFDHDEDYNSADHKLKRTSKYNLAKRNKKSINTSNDIRLSVE